MWMCGLQILRAQVIIQQNTPTVDISHIKKIKTIKIIYVENISDGTIYRIVSNIAILNHIVAYLYRDNYPSNEVDIPHNSAIRPWFILAIIKLM